MRVAPARVAPFEREKALTKARDELSAEPALAVGRGDRGSRLHLPCSHDGARPPGGLGGAEGRRERRATDVEDLDALCRPADSCPLCRHAVEHLVDQPLEVRPGQGGVSEQQAQVDRPVDAVEHEVGVEAGAHLASLDRPPQDLASGRAFQQYSSRKPRPGSCRPRLTAPTSARVEPLLANAPNVKRLTPMWSKRDA